MIRTYNYINFFYYIFIFKGDPRGTIIIFLYLKGTRGERRRWRGWRGRRWRRQSGFQYPLVSRHDCYDHSTQSDWTQNSRIPWTVLKVPARRLLPWRRSSSAEVHTAVATRPKNSSTCTCLNGNYLIWDFVLFGH